VSATPNATDATRNAPPNGDACAAWSTSDPWMAVVGIEEAM
jgi:hypothetical protein